MASSQGKQNKKDALTANLHADIASSSSFCDAASWAAAFHSVEVAQSVSIADIPLYKIADHMSTFEVHCETLRSVLHDHASRKLPLRVPSVLFNYLGDGVPARQLSEVMNFLCENIANDNLWLALSELNPATGFLRSILATMISYKYEVNYATSKSVD